MPKAHDGPDYAHGAPAGGAAVTDPVCGMQVDRMSAAAHRQTGTGTVYFCSIGCAAAFDAQPQGYAATAAGTSSGEGE